MRYKILIILIFASSLLAAENPKVKVHINTWSGPLGSFTVELYPDKAPITVDNFMNYVNNGFYNGLFIHRVVHNFVIQGGGYYYDHEYWSYDYCKYLHRISEVYTLEPIVNESYNGLLNKRSTIAMARQTDPNSATCEFFINTVDNPYLDKVNNPDGFGYCVFGKVIEGMDVIDVINTVRTYGDSGDPNYCHYFTSLPKVAIYMNKVEVLPCDTTYCVDYDDDDVIGFADYADFAQDWFNDDCNSFNLFCSGRDLNYNGSVDVDDFAMLADKWLMTVGSDVSLSDYNSDGSVDFADFAFFVKFWQDDSCSADNSYCYTTDLNRDGTVDVQDFILFAGNWLLEP